MFIYALAFLWPLLQASPVTRTLSKYWHPADTIRTGLRNLAEVAICPTDDPNGGHLLVVDSAGNIAELRWANKTWSVERTFSAGEPVTTACAAAPRVDNKTSLFVGTKSGRVYEFVRGAMGWSKRDVITLSPPIRQIRTTLPGLPPEAELFVVDGKGLVTNLGVVSGIWKTTTLPPTEGGATMVCADLGRFGAYAVTAGPKGIIHKFFRDSTGRWSGGPWTTLSAGPHDMALCSDPRMQDICVWYSGQDGLFRYLFFSRTKDEKAQLPVANGVDRMIGKGDQRRFNEFFAMSGDDFCMFEYEPELEDWTRQPIVTLTSRVAATAFGPGRGPLFHRMYLACVDGTVHEIVRQELEDE